MQRRLLLVVTLLLVVPWVHPGHNLVVISKPPVDCHGRHASHGVRRRAIGAHAHPRHCGRAGDRHHRTGAIGVHGVAVAYRPATVLGPVRWLLSQVPRKKDCLSE